MLEALFFWVTDDEREIMNLRVHKTRVLKGKVEVPSSKSQSIRGVILALLAEGESTLLHPLRSEDMDDALRVAQALGAHVFPCEGSLKIQNQGLPFSTAPKKINTGNSGITTRFILPLLGLCKHLDVPIQVDCGEQMRSRPIRSLLEALEALGLSIQYLKQPGQFPIALSGQLKGGNAEVEGITSQYLSALLLSLPCAPQDSELRVKNLHERPYVDMTLAWLKAQNIHYRHQREKEQDIYFIQGNQSYKAFKKRISGDFSSASYLIAAGVMSSGCVELSGLDMEDSQGDKRLVSLLQEMGADIDITPSGMIIQGGRALRGIRIDANDIPDLLPTLAVLGTYAMGQTEIRNVEQARIKETDRIHSMTEGLSRLGGKVEAHPDGMTIHHSPLRGAFVDGYGDHRTVMALALAGLQAEGSSLIEGSEAMNKTFPGFISTMQSLGAQMETVDAG